jgi:spore maturation protein CgeB
VLIAVFGLTISSSWGNGHATLWRGLCRALARRGHRVAFFERDVPYYAAHRDLGGVPWVDVVLYRTWDDVRARASRTLAVADVAIVTSYCPDAFAATELALDSDALAVFYDLDSPITLERLARGEPVDYVGPRGYADYDLVLSYAGGAALEQLAARLGAARVAPLYGSVDPDAHRPHERTADAPADLSYLGTYSADRQPAVERLFLEPARRLPRHWFTLGGSQYPPEFPWAPNVRYVRHVAPPEHARFFAESRLTLNVTRRAMAEYGRAPSGRMFEAAACGTPVITDAWEGLDEFFAVGGAEPEVLVARDAADVVEAIRCADAELAAIAARARERVLDEHTSARRALELESLLVEAGGVDVSPAALDAPAALDVPPAAAAGA